MMVDLEFDGETFTEANFDRPMPLSSNEAQNAWLGCYYLSSVLKDYLVRLSQGDCPRGKMMYSFIRLQMELEAAYKGTEKPDIFWPVDSHPMSDLSLNTPSINIARLTLSLLEEASVYRIEPTLLEFNFSTFHSIMSRARAFLDYFISVPACDFPHFSFTEWDRLIAGIRVFTEILSAAAGLPGIVAAVGEESRTLTRYLECLGNRMEKLSQSGQNPGEFPDLFYLFKSILDLLCPLPLATTYDQGLSAAVKPEPRLGIKRCPVMSGIQDTEFWDAYQTSVAADNIEIDLGMLFTDEFLLEPLPEQWMDASGNVSYM
ncbi:hypothetical protein BDV26DRAFT_281204 [Aspergillus bertholletiae]|uniref:Transcription factor domain-containing protein n=1 Tax=Aspergillus bertholletiae TaxID=1226010 RepID=A0A5N7B968_9EURO|nr:hypothetical protein BDV26DRAFT_281204 [Aspergillus bertholletiae]